VRQSGEDNKKHRNFLAAALIAGLWALSCTVCAADVPAGCTPIARVVSVQGSLQLQRAGDTAWTWVRRLDTVVCQGDLLHTGPTGRVALLLSPETLFRIQQNSTVSIRQTPDETVVEYTIGDQQAAARTAPNQCGAGYFITRFPKKFRVLTPFINASVEGTEFLVALSCQSATVAVFEGRVLAQQILAADSTAFTLNGGEQVTVGGAEPAAVKLVVKPADAVQWALYYPPLTQPAGEEVADQQCNQADAVQRGQCILQRAEQRLRMGRVEEAEADLRTLSTIAPNSGEPYALRSIIRLTKNEKAEALSLAERATMLSPASSRAWLALSYAHQAAFDLEKALETARKSAELDASSSTIQARVAELLMSLGRIRAAEKVARAAVAANPNNSRAHTVLGFVHLAQINTKAARETFLMAIERDSSDPLPRLGLGLATIRDGDLKAGREQIEIAVVLDPANSLIRSYMGKAYYEENTQERDGLAAIQFGIAKRLDPKDPTAWFYDAILKQTQNRPVEALEDIQTSIELNDNRAVYRSRLLLDEDRGARAAGVARMYQNLGFTRRGLMEAYTSLQTDPSSYSAHQFLADIYSTLPKHEIARVSESLQAQLRQPINAPPLEPELADDRVGGKLTTIQGIRGRGFAEYSQLFERPGLDAQLDFNLGSRDTVLNQFILSPHSQVLRLNVGVFHYQTDGFEFNSNAEKELYTALVQMQPDESTSFQAEVRYLESQRGDTRFAFDPDLTVPLRIDESVRNYRIGAYHSVSPASELLFSAAYQDRAFENPLLGFPSTDSFTSAWSTVEGQYVWQRTLLNVVLGISHLDGEDRIDDGSFERKVTHDIGYIYGHIGDPSKHFSLVLGASIDDLDSINLRRDQANPKVGILLYPWEGSTVRAAWFKSVKRQIIANQTLEPTSVAGFNQFFDDPTGSNIRTAGVGFDQALGRSLFLGVEFYDRDLDVPSLTETDFDDLPWREENYRGYAYWALPKSLAGTWLRPWSLGLSVEFLKENLERHEEITGVEGIRFLDTTSVPATISAHHPSGVSLRLSISRVSQEGELRANPQTAAFPQDVSFWVTDADIGYRLPRRRGFFSVGVRNLFDESIQFVDTDPVVRRYAPERFVFARLNLFFQ
jgi:tetratricopeptide (TPR) repeat protein